MSLQVIELGEVEPISAFVVSSVGNPLTGKTDILVRVRRGSDGQYLDWDDLAFKSAGWVELNKTMTEVDAVNAAGVYELVGGFDSGTVTGLADTEDLLFIVTQSPGIDAKVPSPLELQVRPGAGSITPGVIANAIWEALQSSHLTAGTMGAAMNSILAASVAGDFTTIAGSSVSEIRTGATQPDGFYNNMTVLISGASGSVVREITGYVQTNGAFTVAPDLPFTPAPGDKVFVLGASGGSNTLALIKNQADKIDLIATLGTSAVATGSLMDRLMNKGTGKSYNQATDSLEAIRDRVG